LLCQFKEGRNEEFAWKSTHASYHDCFAILQAFVDQGEGKEVGDLLFAKDIRPALLTLCSFISNSMQGIVHLLYQKKLNQFQVQGLSDRLIAVSSA
jgi:hypothetical protein